MCAPAPAPGPAGAAAVAGEVVSWYRPARLDELLALKAQCPGAKIVVGNTEVGIEMKFKDMKYPVIIAPTHVPELNQVGAERVLGGCCGPVGAVGAGDCGCGCGNVAVAA